MLIIKSFGVGNTEGSLKTGNGLKITDVWIVVIDQKKDCRNA